DADDLISEQYLEYCYWGLYFNKDADWAYTWSVGFQNNMYLWKKPFNAEEIKQNNTLVLTSAIRKSLWEQVGGFKKEEIAYNEDWRFWLDCLSLSKKPVCLAGYHFWYRRTDEGMLNTLKNDDIRVYLSDRITENAAKTVDKNVRAKHYPINSCDNLYSFNDNTEWALEYTVEKNNNIRMLWIVPWVVMGGADKFNIDAAKGLSERGYDISIMTTIPSDNEWLYKCKEFTDEIFCLPDFIDETNYLSFVDYYIKSRQIDILMVTNSTVGYYMVPYIRQKYPKMVIVDYVHMEEWYWKAGGHARTSSRLSDITDMTFVCNSATERVMIDQLGHPAESINTLHIGVDSDTFYKDIVEEGFLYRLAQLDENRPIVLFPCRIHPQKRPFMVIDIAKKASRIVPNIAFVVVGDGPQLEELKQTIKKNGLEHTIICIGATDRMAECYKDAKLTLICSLKEGLALTAYESCSMGVPVISSDVGGQGDLIDWEVGALISLCQDEETSLDCREYNESEVDEYAKAICDYLQDDKRYKSAAKKCRERIVNDFSVNRMVEKLDNN
ncbi:MAG: glycosyltransferase family 4 protein, partial [Pseudobutyrivibrio sp.]|nr:glycosyltransferase family 4 protein [Pseudobutyrivibrio sp.]